MIANRSRLLFFKEQQEQNEWVALFTFSNTRAIHSLWKSNLLFLREGFAPFWRENWKLDLYHTFWLCSGLGICSFALHSFALVIFTKRAKRALSKRAKKERFALLKWASFLVKKRAIGTKTKERIPNHEKYLGKIS